MEKNSKKKNEKKEMERELYKSMMNGIVLYLDGEVSSPKKISEAVLREDNTYMADLVADDHGYIREIRYDNIHL